MSASKPPTGAKARAWSPPGGACDCHTHVFADAARFPLKAPLSYPVPDADYPRHRQIAQAAGLHRAILVQPAPYADDPAGIIDALGHSQGRLKGVGAASATTPTDVMERLAAAGVKGLRFVEARLPDGRPYAGTVGLDQLPLMAPRMRRFGFHMELWAPLDVILDRLAEIEAAGLPLVLDHMAGVDPAEGLNDVRFRRLLTLVSQGQVAVKLVLSRRSPHRPEFADLRPFHDALVDAGPGQMLWGSDWPFVRMENPPHVGQLLDVFAKWVDDPDLQRQILVDNPARIYGFESPS